MTYEQQVTMWLNAIEMMTPLSDYDDLHACLLWACKSQGLEDYGTIINTAYEEEGLNGDRLTSYLEAERNFCGRITFTVDETLAAGTHFVVYTDSNGTITLGYPDENGVVSNLLPTGTYTATFYYVSGTSATPYYCTTEGWSATGTAGTIPLGTGDTFTLNSLHFEEAPSGGNESSEKTGLKLVRVEGTDFSLVMPEGWRIETGGSGSEFWFMLFDPENPSMRCFYYGTLAPFLKSQEAKNLYGLTDRTGIFSNAPVLPALTSEALLTIWQDCIDYQTLMGVNTFVPLYNITPIETNYVEGIYSAYGCVESVTAATCSTDYDADVTILLETAFTQDCQLVDGVDIWPATAYGTMAVMAKSEELADVYEDLLTCLNSLELTESSGASLTGEGAENPFGTESSALPEGTLPTGDGIRSYFAYPTK